MPRRHSELLGHIECPKCHNPKAEVRRDRGGNPFTKCHDAAHTPPLVIPTHGGDAGDALLYRMKAAPRPRLRSALALELTALHAAA